MIVTLTDHLTALVLQQQQQVHWVMLYPAGFECGHHSSNIYQGAVYLKQAVAGMHQTLKVRDIAQPPDGT